MSSRQNNGIISAVGEEVQIQGETHLGEHVVLDMPALQPSPSHATDVEAVCRICLDDLSGGGETLLLECRCRGELALTHKECAIKWFSRKGNNKCEVCNQIIQNLPLDLLTISRTTTTGGHEDAEVGTNWGIFRVCQEAPGFVVANVFAYLLFLLKYLAKDMADLTLVVSLLLSCMLGYLSAVTSTTMARGRYVWLYGMVQCIGVIISTYTLHFVVKLKRHPLICILFASMVGFGVAFCCGCIVVGSLKIRTWWLQQRQQGANENANNN